MKHLEQSQFGLWSKQVLSTLLTVVSLSLLSGCKSESPNLDKFSKDFKQSFEDAQKAVDDFTPSRKDIADGTTKEFAKLFNLEYKVTEVNIDLSAPELEKVLATLGEDRWEVFHVSENNLKLRILCKRRPQTYLRYVPRMFP